jgi:copper homeostasis protein
VSGILEVIATSVTDAIAAERGGATRLEVIRRFEQDGLTPPLSLVKDILDAVRIPIRVMLRERDDFRVTGDDELAKLCEQAHALAQLSVDGMVLGFLRGGEVDIASVQGVTACASGVRLTFHRAFEAVHDPRAAIDALKRLGQVDCILTNGGNGSWRERSQHLQKLQQLMHPNMDVLVGGGVNGEAIETVCTMTPIRAFHLGRAVREPQTVDGVVSAARVAAMKQRLAAFDLA